MLAVGSPHLGRGAPNVVSTATSLDTLDPRCRTPDLGQPHACTAKLLDEEEGGADAPLAVARRAGSQSSAAPLGPVRADPALGSPDPRPDGRGTPAHA